MARMGTRHPWNGMKPPSPIPSIAFSKVSLAELLVRAVDQLDSAAFHAVLSRTRSIDVPTPDGRTPYTAVLDALQECLRDRSATRRMDILLDMARSLKALGAQDFRRILGAASTGDLPEVKRLIQSGVPVNFSVVSSGTALDAAINGGHTETVAFLRSTGGVDLLPSSGAVLNFMNEFKKLAAVDCDLASQILQESTKIEMTDADPNPFLIQILKRARGVCHHCQTIKSGLFADIWDRYLLNLKQVEYRQNLISVMTSLMNEANQKRRILKSQASYTPVALTQSHRSLHRSPRAEVESSWHGKIPLSMAIEAGDSEWARRLVQDGSDPKKLCLQRLEFECAEETSICSIYLASPVHVAVKRRDMGMLVAMVKWSRPKKGFWGSLMKSAIRFFGLPGGRTSDADTVSAEFQGIADVRQMVFSWQIPTSTLELERSVERIMHGWKRLGVEPANLVEKRKLIGKAPNVLIDVLNPLVGLALRSPRSLARAVPQGSWSSGKSILEEIWDTPCARHLSVLFETGLPLSKRKLIGALGDDLAALAERIEVFAAGEFDTREDFDEPLKELRKQLSGLCGRIRELAPDCPGTEHLIKNAGVDRSRSMHSWIRAMRGMLDDASPRHQQKSFGEPAAKMPNKEVREIATSLSRPWVAKICLLVAACKLIAK